MKMDIKVDQFKLQTNQNWKNSWDIKLQQQKTFALRAGEGFDIERGGYKEQIGGFQ